MRQVHLSLLFAPPPIRGVRGIICLALFLKTLFLFIFFKFIMILTFSYWLSLEPTCNQSSGRVMLAFWYLWGWAQKRKYWCVHLRAKSNDTCFRSVIRLGVSLPFFPKLMLPPSLFLLPTKKKNITPTWTCFDSSHDCNSQLSPPESIPPLSLSLESPMWILFFFFSLAAKGTLG